MKPATEWKLTPRQRETLDLMRKLGCQKLVARRMNISTRTIQVQLNLLRHENEITEPQLLVYLAWSKK